MHVEGVVALNLTLLNYFWVVAVHTAGMRLVDFTHMGEFIRGPNYRIR